MNQIVHDIEVLADNVSDHPLTEAEQARIASAAQRVVNQTKGSRQ